MDVLLKEQLHENSCNYKRSLDRIIEKYSKLQYHDGGPEIDFDTIQTRTLQLHLKQSRLELKKLESKSLTDLREESLRDISSTTSLDITRNSQLDFTHQDGGADETCVSASQLSGEDEVTVSSSATQLTVSSLDESLRNLSETELQPEDRDEELEMTLRSRGSSFVELYPSMISRIERAWRRQNVSEAADSVLRRYRRWRQQPSRSNLSNTFVVTLRNTSSNPRKMMMMKMSKMLPKDNFVGVEQRQLPRPESVPRSPLRVATNLQAWHAPQLSPERARGSLRREQHPPILAMDLSGFSGASRPEEMSLNKTFTVSERSWLRELPGPHAASPSRPRYPAARSPLDLPLRSKRLSLSAHSEQAAGFSVHTSEVPVVKDRSDLYGSPVRRSPFKARAVTSLGGSPHAFTRSPKERSAESFSREHTRPRSLFTSLSSPLNKPLLYAQDSHLPLQPQLRSPASAAAGGRLRLRRHLSFDSSLPSLSVSYSPKKVDEDFIKLYHKFVCQNKSSFFSSLPCRLCARGPEAGGSHSSSSALAALALSPHRSVLRKRHREVGCGGRPHSKRSKDERCTSSPGSRRHGNEMLRRRLSLSEPSHDDLSYRLGRHGALNRLSSQRGAADAHQGAWMRGGRPASAAEFSGLGSSLESSFANGYSPRKW